jgi:hypothetical protein
MSLFQLCSLSVSVFACWHTVLNWAVAFGVTPG